MANTHSLDLEASSSQYASITDASQTGLDFSTTFTCEFQLKIETLGDGSTQYVWTKSDFASNSQRGYNVRVSRSGSTYRVVAEVDAGDGTRDRARWDLTAGAAEWVHLAVTCDVGNPSATTFEAFEEGSSLGNGTMEASSNITAINNNAEPFRIGATGSSGAAGFYDGLVDDVRAWNDVRTSGEISANYNTELTGSEAGLVGYWKLDNNYTDETSNSNDLTASGSPVFSTDVPDFGTTYTSTLTEVISLVDTVNFSMLRDLTESIDLVDNLQNSTVRVFQDSITVLDALTKTITPLFNETLTLVDSLNKQTTRTLTETLTLVDILQNTLNRNFNETLTLTDTLIKNIYSIFTNKLTYISALTKVKPTGTTTNVNKPTGITFGGDKPDGV